MGHGASAGAGDGRDLAAEYERLLATLPTRAPIFLPTDKVPLPQRVAGLRRVAEIYRDRLEHVHRPRLRALRERYLGSRRCFVVGNGPSLNRTDLAALSNEVTFCVNGFFLKMPELNWVPTFYVVEDHLVAEDRAGQITALKGPTKLFPVYLAYCFEEAPDTIFFNHRPRKSYPHGFDFSLDAAQVTYTGCTVTNTTLQLAHYFGFEEIYLIGVDADYGIPADAKQSTAYGVGVLDMESDDPNHFHPDYFGKGYRWHDPQVDKMLEAYAEAERVTRATGRCIYNAGIGGRLEVFQRVPFTTVLPHARSAEEMDRFRKEADALRPPRLLLLDMTRVGGGTATGEVKRALMGEWPPGSILQLYSGAANRLCVSDNHLDDSSPEMAMEETELFQRIAGFAAEAILYRPVSDKPALHRAAMQAIAASNAPLAVWIMDDWIERLRAEKPDEWPDWQQDLAQLMTRATLRLSISDAMSRQLAERYGGEWCAFANGVNPADWPPARSGAAAAGRSGRLLVRFAGGLAEDMTLQSVVDVAEAVSRLAERHEVRFEINTRSYWLRVNGARLLGLRGVSVTSRALDTAAYRKWLAGADVALIAYNFDDRTRRYVQTSMANKAPECLASGAAVLGYGPPDFNTIAELAALGCAELVTSRDPAALDAALLRLLKDVDRRVALGESGRRVAFTRFNLPSIRKAFTDRFRDLAAAGQAQDLDALETERAALEERLRTLGREIARRRARRPAPDQRADAVEAAWAALTWLPVPLAGVAAGQSAPQRGPHQVAQAADARTGAS